MSAQQNTTAPASTRFRFVNVDLKTHRDIEFPNDEFASADDMAASLRNQGHSVKVLDDGDEFKNFVSEVYGLYNVDYLLVRQ